MPYQDDMEPFESPKLLIENARENLIKLETHVGAFLADCPYEIVEKTENQAGERVVTAQFKKRMPGKIRLIASEIVNGLRHALDQAVCDASLELGAANAKNTYFPFAEDPDQLPSEIANRCKKVDPAMIDFIKQYRPYNGGNSELWALSRLAGPGKHQRIVHLARGGSRLDFTGHAFETFGPMVLHMRWNERRNELELARLGSQAFIIGGFSIPLEIVIGEADVVGGQRALDVLGRFANEVERIVLEIEAETARLKATKL